MKIAIIGAGLAGLSACWHLSCYPEMQIYLFDPKGIGQGASAVPSGLMHPFPGRRSLLSWRADEGMAATNALLSVAENALGRSVADRSGVFRPAITAQQKRDFMQSGAQWIQHPLFGEGLWIESGMAVYTRLYLEGLWKACSQSGAQWVPHTICSLRELDAFDCVIVAAGFQTHVFDGCQHLPLRTTKGQVLLCRWEERIPCSLVSQGHITPMADPSLCQIGSTYEEAYQSLTPDVSKAATLQFKVAQFYPKAAAFAVVDVWAGARISRPRGYRPIVTKIDAKTWVFTGLGSRGLLYHAYLGKELARAVFHGLPSLEPREEFLSLFS